MKDDLSRRRRRRLLWLAIPALLLAGGLLYRGTLVELWHAHRRLQELDDEHVEAGDVPAVNPDDARVPHPIDPALDLAREALAHVRASVTDCTVVISKRERIGDELKGPQRFFAKIRHRREGADGERIPLGVYLRFQEPPSMAGREVIWVEGRNDGRMIAHEGGLLGIARLRLDPTSLLAMAGNRYPITEIGIERLLERLVELGERNRRRDECEVALERGILVDGIPCTRIEVRHPRPREHFDFHLAEVYLDERRLVPLRYASYDWPRTPGGPPVLVEEYAFEDLRLNVGLTDADFDPDNPEYDFP